MIALVLRTGFDKTTHKEQFKRVLLTEDEARKELQKSLIVLDYEQAQAFASRYEALPITEGTADAIMAN